MAGKVILSFLLPKTFSNVHFKWLFIIFGLVTFLWGVLMLLRLSDSAKNAKFLIQEERIIAIERLKENETEYKNTHIDREQIWEAFTDAKTWLLVVFILACDIPNGVFTTVRASLHCSHQSLSTESDSSTVWYSKDSASILSTLSSWDSLEVL